MAMPSPVPAPVAELDPDTRAAFLGRVYQHLALAVAAFIVFESLLFFTGAAEALYDFVAGASASWLLILGAFMVVNWMATTAAHDIQNDRPEAFADVVGDFVTRGMNFLINETDGLINP